MNTLNADLVRHWKHCAEQWEALGPEIGEATGYLWWNPGLYGLPWFEARMETYPVEKKSLVTIGLNPGPYGMAQTGIPFTDIKRLREQLPRLTKLLEERGYQVKLPGLAPASLQPYLKLSHEASSFRVYHFLNAAWGSAEAGLQHVFFANPCMLLFIEPETGKNRTPADFKRAIRANHPDWPAARIDDLLERVAALRTACTLEAITLIQARGCIMLGKDVSSIVGPNLQSIMPERDIVPYVHPARAEPVPWTQNLLAELRKRGLLA